MCSLGKGTLCTLLVWKHLVCQKKNKTRTLGSVSFHQYHDEDFSNVTIAKRGENFLYREGMVSEDC